MQRWEKRESVLICITIFQNLVFIPGFFLRHLSIPAAIIGWGCHPRCVICGQIKIIKNRREND